MILVIVTHFVLLPFITNPVFTAASLIRVTTPSIAPTDSPI